MDSALLQQAMQPINDVCSHLSVGVAWHKKVANECRKVELAICRGWGRWHDAEADCDSKLLLCFTKIVGDNLKHSPVVDTTALAKAHTYTIADFEAFKKHHTDWAAREGRFIETLNMLRPLSADLSMQIYEEICCMLKEVQNEKMRAEWVYANCTMVGWEKHDVKVTSHWLHDYFEHCYKGGPIDFNIG